MTFKGYQQKQKLKNEPEPSTGRSKATNETDAVRVPKTALNALDQYFSIAHMQTNSNLDFCLYERTNKIRRDRVDKKLAKQWK